MRTSWSYYTYALAALLTVINRRRKTNALNARTTHTHTLAYLEQVFNGFLIISCAVQWNGSNIAFDNYAGTKGKFIRFLAPFLLGGDTRYIVPIDT